MIIKRIRGCTRVIGQSQGFLGLPLRDEVRPATIGGEVVDCRAMVTAWEPPPDELKKLASGAPVYLTILGAAHPPVLLEVGDAPS